MPKDDCERIKQVYPNVVLQRVGKERPGFRAKLPKWTKKS